MSGLVVVEKKTEAVNSDFSLLNYFSYLC